MVLTFLTMIYVRVLTTTTSKAQHQWVETDVCVCAGSGSWELPPSPGINPLVSGQ